MTSLRAAPMRKARRKLVFTEGEGKIPDSAVVAGAFLYGSMLNRITGKKRFVMNNQTWEIDPDAQTVYKVDADNPKGVKEKLKSLGAKVPMLPKIEKWQLAVLILGFIVLLAAAMLGGPSSETVMQSSPGKMPVSSQVPPSDVLHNTTLSSASSSNSPESGVEGTTKLLLSLIPLMIAAGVLAFVTSLIARNF